ncbi:MAG TPA: Spy/CpxP family protein refolding chaperone [Myxococcota bacterium]|nr:Spy/CpxP family protein refolding chaperone [Myxococcota bacterium]
MRPTVRLTLAAIAALPFWFVSPAFADPPGPGGPGGPGMEARFEKKLDQLGLNDAQSQKVHAILDSAKPQRDAMRTQIRQAFQDMHALLDQDTPDQNAVLAQADKIGQLTTQAHKNMLTTLLAVRAELTPDQRSKLKESMRDHGGRRFHRWHKGGPGNGGSDSGNGSSTPAPTEPSPAPED